MANGEVNGSAKGAGRGRKVAPELVVPMTVYRNREQALGNTPNNDKAALHALQYDKQHEGRLVKVAVYTWATTSANAAKNFLKHCFSSAEIHQVSEKDINRWYRQKDKASASGQSPADKQPSVPTSEPASA